MTGGLALPGQPGYELRARWDRSQQLRPAAVPIAAAAEDVAETMRFASAHHYRAVHCTGHGPSVPKTMTSFSSTSGSLHEVVSIPWRAGLVSAPAGSGIA